MRAGRSLRRRFGGRSLSLPPPHAAAAGRESVASRCVSAPTGLGAPLAPVAWRGEGGATAGKSVEGAALVAGSWPQESAANPAVVPMQLGSDSRPGRAAPVADEQ